MTASRVKREAESGQMFFFCSKLSPLISRGMQDGDSGKIPVFRYEQLFRVGRPERGAGPDRAACRDTDNRRAQCSLYRGQYRSEVEGRWYGHAAQRGAHALSRYRISGSPTRRVRGVSSPYPRGGRYGAANRAGAFGGRVLLCFARATAGFGHRIAHRTNVAAPYFTGCWTCDEMFGRGRAVGPLGEACGRDEKTLGHQLATSRRIAGQNRASADHGYSRRVEGYSGASGKVGRPGRRGPLRFAAEAGARDLGQCRWRKGSARFAWRGCRLDAHVRQEHRAWPTPDRAEQNPRGRAAGRPTPACESGGAFAPRAPFHARADGLGKPNGRPAAGGGYANALDPGHVRVAGRVWQIMGGLRAARLRWHPSA